MIRTTEARALRIASRLSPREAALIDSLDRVRVATPSQLKRLHFTEGTSLAAARQCQRTLTRLAKLRVLTRLGRRVGGPGGGSAEYVYALDTVGQRLGSALGPAGGARVRKPWTSSNRFILHAVAISEVFVRLKEHEAKGAIELAAFDAEPYCWRRFAAPGGGTAWLKPDCFVHLAGSRTESFFFVEVDRNTQSVPAVARKLARYRHYRQSGREQRRYGLFPKVLILCPTTERIAALRPLLAKQPSSAAKLFQLEQFDEVCAVMLGRTS